MFLQNSGSAGSLITNASEITGVIWQSINGLFTSIVSRLPHLIAGLAVIVLFYLFAIVAKRLFLSASTRTRLDERLRILFSRLIVVLVCVLGLFTALTIVIPSFVFGDFIAGLGLTSLAIGFATKDILNHLISGVLILWQQPFRIGDYIILKDDEGWVKSIGVRATTLRRSTGETVLVPNGDIYSCPFRVRRAGSSYPLSIRLVVDYGTDLGRVKRIVLDTLTSSERVMADPPPKVVVTDLTEDGVRINANFRIDSNEHRPLETYDEVASHILAALDEAGIDLYPPTTTLVLPDEFRQSTKTAENGRSGPVVDETIQ